MKKNKILITGAAGFIGAGLTRALAAAGNDVTGIDIINDYYDINLKYGRSVLAVRNQSRQRELWQTM
jgi:nucleoside-diphosphate-sugar epimerase